jgi:small subunit ribosomal protein S4
VSRYTGPRLRVMRALGTDLPGLSAKSIERRPYPPGQHDVKPRRRRESPYGERLHEKQRLRINYGLSERQFRIVVSKARQSGQDTPEALLSALESRLDNVVFRAGFARTIPAARQLIVHGHVMVSGRKVDRPSFRVRTGHRVGLTARGARTEVIAAAMLQPRFPAPRWMQMNAETKEATIAAMPDASSVLVAVDVRLIIEYYAQRL